MKKAAEIISALFKESFGHEFMETHGAGIFSSWNKIAMEAWSNVPYFRNRDEEKVDDVPAAASHSRIKELQNGLLIVEADHPGWVQILQTKQKELLEAAQRGYPELNIRGISFKLSREPF